MNADEARNKSVSIWENLPIEDYRFTEKTPSEYQWLSDYNPNLARAFDYDPATISEAIGRYTAQTLDPNAGTYSASLIGPVNPFSTVNYDAFVGDAATINQSDINKSRQLQLDNIGKWDNLVKNGLSVDEASAIRNIQNAAQTARSRADQSIKNDMIARGVAGSGNEFAQRLNASQAAANLASNQGDELSKLMIDRQNQALAASGGLSADLRNSDQNLASQQAELYNSFQRNRENLINSAREYAANQTNAANAWAAQTNAANAAANAAAQNEAGRFNASSLLDALKFNTNSVNTARATSAANDLNREAANMESRNTARNQSAQNQQAVEFANMDAINSGNLYGLTNKQALFNLNTDLRNEYMRENDDAYNAVAGLRNQQRFNAASGLSNALNGHAAGMDNAQAAQQQNKNARTQSWINLATGTLGAVSKAGDLIKSIWG